MGQLTLRGRCFLGAGLAAALCGVQVGQADFVRIGLVVVVIPVAAWIVVRLRPVHPVVRRELGRQRVEAGEATTVEVVVRPGGTRAGRTPALLVEEQLPPALGTRHDFLVGALAPGAEARLPYPLRTTRRGRYAVGPLRVHHGDPLGMVDVVTTAGEADSLLVTPATERLPAIPLAGRLAGTGDQRTRDLLGGGSPDVTTREYRVGDDLRRVHWPTSARTDTLMVRREEQDWQLRCTLLLDDRRYSHGSGRHGTFEAAVGAAASVVHDLAGRGFEVHLATAGGLAGAGAVTPGPAAHLERLAVIAPDSRERLDLGWVSGTRQGGLLVAVLGRLAADDTGHLARLAAAADAAYAVVHDLGDGEAAETTARLRRAGWKAATRAPGGPLAPAWQELAR